MAYVRRGISAPGGERYELRGRFLAHVAQLEFMARMIVLGYLTGDNQGHDPRGRILHDSLLRYTNLDRLTETLKSIMKAQEEPVREEWTWITRDLKELARRRNQVAHIPAYWQERPDHLDDEHAEETITLLLKVDGGLAGLGTALLVIAADGAPDVSGAAEAECQELAASSAPEELAAMKRPHEPDPEG
jgi:hypothetical protein